ncbi:unnamed protein product [Closterium sp. NIES-65]|nr:unnamed protein product [Closterium sp. NIES-65]
MPDGHPPSPPLSLPLQSTPLTQALQTVIGSTPARPSRLLPFSWARTVPEGHLVEQALALLLWGPQRLPALRTGKWSAKRLALLLKGGQRAEERAGGRGGTLMSPRELFLMSNREREELADRAQATVEGSLIDDIPSNHLLRPVYSGVRAAVDIIQWKEPLATILAAMLCLFLVNGQAPPRLNTFRQCPLPQFSVFLPLPLLSVFSIAVLPSRGYFWLLPALLLLLLAAIIIFYRITNPSSPPPQPPSLPHGPGSPKSTASQLPLGSPALASSPAPPASAAGGRWGMGGGAMRVLVVEMEPSPTTMGAVMMVKDGIAAALTVFQRINVALLKVRSIFQSAEPQVRALGHMGAGEQLVRHPSPCASPLPLRVTLPLCITPPPHSSLTRCCCCCLAGAAAAVVVPLLVPARVIGTVAVLHIFSAYFNFQKQKGGPQTSSMGPQAAPLVAARARSPRQGRCRRLCCRRCGVHNCLGWRQAEYVTVLCRSTHIHVEAAGAGCGGGNRIDRQGEAGKERTGGREGGRLAQLGGDDWGRDGVHGVRGKGSRGMDSGRAGHARIMSSRSTTICAPHAVQMAFSTAVRAGDEAAFGCRH